MALVIPGNFKTTDLNAAVQKHGKGQGNDSQVYVGDQGGRTVTVTVAYS